MAKARAWGKTGYEVVSVGQGTYQLEYGNRTRAIAAVQAGVDAGLTHIDTAEMYGSGRVETLLGEALAGRRDRVFLVTKVWPTNASRKGTIQSCERSLKRLGTDRVDCYLLHWRSSHPVEETVEALEKLQSDGKIRSWGVSNFDQRELANVIAVAGEGRVSCNQVYYDLRHRQVELDLLPYCQTHSVAVVAYSPLGAGYFPSRDATLDAIARAHHATPQQIALAFLTRLEGTFVIPKAVSDEHIRQNAAVDSLRLSDADCEQLERAFPKGSDSTLPVR